MFRRRFEKIINSYHIVLFMRGTLSFPMCGLSEKVCFLLKKNKVDFKTENLLQDPELHIFLRRENSPSSVPYLYVDGDFVGGYDEIITEIEKGNCESFLKR